MMEVLKEDFPRTHAWIDSLKPFIVIRGDNQVIIKFADGRLPLELSYDKIRAFEKQQQGDAFSWNN
jgi:hypothetical protein